MDTTPPHPSATVEDAHSSTAAAAEDRGEVGEPPPAYSSAAAEIDGDVFGKMEEEADEKRMSIAERRAGAGVGFCMPRTISTARFRWAAASPVTAPLVVSIPPGLSPAVLLDSPLMMHDSQVVDRKMPPSPTTGTLPSLDREFLVATGKEQKEEKNEISYAFKDIHSDPLSIESPPNAESDPLSIESPPNAESYQVLEGQPNDTSELTTQFEELQDGVDAGLQHVYDEDDAVPVPATVVGRPSEDGYNWRKYGQKQVKGSEYPRSYYKCTQPSCLVKKKVERCYDGQITEIIYKGFHNHPKPLPNRRSMLGMTFPLSEASEDVSMAASFVKTEKEPFRSSQQNSGSLKEDGAAGGLERAASASLRTDMSYLLSGSSKTHLGFVNSAEAREFSHMPSSQGEDDVTTQSSMLVQENGNESDPKRRRLETCSFESSFASRNVREQKVVIETESEVDILDDGYRWRKYGQKVVKGNPNPRSYYKCTSPGCPVRKHVERASRDLRFVVTTYEGKHTHEVPTSRSNAQSCPGGGSNSNNGPNDVDATLSPHASTSLTLPKHEPIRPDLLPVFMRSGGGFTGDTFVGATPFYDMKLGPLGHLNLHHANIPQVPSVCSVLPDYPRCFPVDPQGHPIVASCGFDSARGGPAGLGNLSLLQQQQHHPSATEARLLRPMKQEQDDGGVYASCLPINHHLANAPIAVYDQLPGGFEFN